VKRLSHTVTVAGLLAATCCNRKRLWKLKRIVPIGVRTTHKQFDWRLLSNRGPSHVAFALRLNEFAVKMPRSMAQYR